MNVYFLVPNAYSAFELIIFDVVSQLFLNCQNKVFVIEFLNWRTKEIDFREWKLFRNKVSLSVRL